MLLIKTLRLAVVRPAEDKPLIMYVTNKDFGQNLRVMQQGSASPSYLANWWICIRINNAVVFLISV